MQNNQEILQRARELHRTSPDTLTSNDYKFKKGVIAATKKFKELKTGRLPDEKCFLAMVDWTHEVSQIYRIPTPTLKMWDIIGISSGPSHYLHQEKTIVLVGKLSIITLFHEYAHHLYFETKAPRCADGSIDYMLINTSRVERHARRWSLNLFKRVWPKQWAKLSYNELTGMVYRREGDAQ